MITKKIIEASPRKGGVSVTMTHRGQQDTVSTRHLGVSGGSSDDKIDEDNWKTFANCRGMSVDVFFGERGDPPSKARQAKLICSTCPVKKSCLMVALSQSDDNHGIFGGASSKERRIIKRMLRLNPNYLATDEAIERYGLQGAY
jgi:WhiB family redox-sensing transcriptional regulator